MYIMHVCILICRICGGVLLDSWLTAQDQVTYHELIHDTLTAQQALSKEYQR